MCSRQSSCPTQVCGYDGNRYGGIEYVPPSAIDIARRSTRELLKVSENREYPLAFSLFNDRVTGTFSTIPLPTTIQHLVVEFKQFFDCLHLQPGGGTQFGPVIDIALQLSGLKKVFITDGDGGTFEQICTPENLYCFDYGIVIGRTNENVIAHLCKEVIHCSSQNEFKDTMLLLLIGTPVTKTINVAVPKHVVLSHPSAKFISSIAKPTDAIAGPYTLAGNCLNVLPLEEPETVGTREGAWFAIDCSGSMGDQILLNVQTLELKEPVHHQLDAVASIWFDKQLTGKEDSMAISENDNTSSFLAVEEYNHYELLLQMDGPLHFCLGEICQGDEIFVNGSLAQWTTELPNSHIVKMMDYSAKLFKILDIIQTADSRIMWSTFVKEAYACLMDPEFQAFIDELEPLIEESGFLQEYLNFTTAISSIVELEKMTRTAADIRVARLAAADVGNSRQLTAQASRYISAPIENSGQGVTTRCASGALAQAKSHVVEDVINPEKCSVCITEDATVMIVPCGHVSMCAGCTPAAVCGLSATQIPFVPQTGHPSVVENIPTQGCMMCRGPIQKLVYLEPCSGLCACGSPATIVSIDCKHRAFCVVCHRLNLKAKKDGKELPKVCRCGTLPTQTIDGYW
jgi:hypothetical protein